MTNELITKYIEVLNEGSFADTIYKHQIANDVDIAKVWSLDSDVESLVYDFFFIKENSHFVGAVYRMADDLHWLILPMYRGKGLLTNALKNTILPYLFDRIEIEEQKITITESEIGMTNYIKSCKVALSVGFKQVDKSNFVYREGNEILKYKNSDEKYVGLSQSELNFLSNELNKSALRLEKINTLIENRYSTTFTDYNMNNLPSIANKIRSCNFDIQNLTVDFSSLSDKKST